MKTTADRIKLMRLSVCEDMIKMRAAYSQKDLVTLEFYVERMRVYYIADIISELAYNRAWNMYALAKWGEKME